MQSPNQSPFGPIHSKVASAIDRAMTPAAEFLGWCGKNGKKGGLSVRFADLFWVECNCCNFYRGVAVGVFMLAFLQLVVYVASVAVVASFGFGIAVALAIVKAIEPVAEAKVATPDYSPQSEFEGQPS